MELKHEEKIWFAEAVLLLHRKVGVSDMRIKLLLYILGKRDDNDSLRVPLRTVAAVTGVSYKVVATTFKTLRENGLLEKVDAGRIKGIVHRVAL